MKDKSEALVSWKWAIGAVYFVAAMNTLIAKFASYNGGRVGDFRFDSNVLFGAGLLYLVLGILASNRVAPALWIALALFGLDTVGMLVTNGGAGHSMGWGLWLRFAILVCMYRGIPALTLLAQPESPAPAPKPAAPQDEFDLNATVVAPDLYPRTPSMSGHTPRS